MVNKATKQNPEYGHDIQKLYLEMLMTDSESYVRCQSVFDPDNYDQRLQPPARFIQQYVAEHNVMPTFEIVNAATGAQLKDPGKLHESHYDWLLSEYETFARHKALEAAILRSADLLERGEYGPVEDLVKRAVQIGLQKELGTDYWADPRGRLEAIKSNNGQIQTGWSELDRKLFGGMNRGELNLFLGGSGAGKSLFLANLGVNWALQGLNVLYFTFELSENLVSMRIDSMVTGITTSEVFRNIDDVDMKVRIIGKKSGAFQVKYMPSGKNVNDLRSYIREYEIKTGRRVDVVLIDYLDLMMPAGTRVSASDLFVKDKYVSEELRNLSMELNTITVSACQLNRCLALDTEVEVEGKGTIQIKNIAEGDLILSDSGYNKVTGVSPIARQKVYQIKTKSGKTIRCSAEHIFPTVAGEKKINTGLSVGDILYRKDTQL